MDLELLYARRFDYAQSTVQITHACFLSLAISGLEYSRVYTPGGRKYGDGGNRILRLTPPGFKIDFSYGADRENMVIVCNIPELHYDEQTDRLLLRHRDTELTLRRLLKLTSEQTFHFRSIYERIIYLMQSQLPADLFAAEQLTAGILAELACSERMPVQPEHDRPNLADRLKQALDDDREIRVSLQGHCRKLGYSPEYARRCFRSKFDIDPQEYRLRLRLEHIFQLMNMHCYTMKEIADLAGMKNVTHLHSFIRQRCGMTPRELAKKFPL